MFALPSTQRTIAVLIALVAALALLVLGVPRTLAAFAARPGNTDLWHIKRGSEIPPEGVSKLMESRRAALKWSDKGGYWAELALAQLLLARSHRADAVEPPALLGHAAESG